MYTKISENLYPHYSSCMAIPFKGLYIF
ncbi:hypothetical protein LINPERPRIM_LOCUS25603 [Linum perenne]